MKKTILFLNLVLLQTGLFAQTIYDSDGMTNSDRLIRLSRNINFEGQGGNMFFDGSLGNLAIGSTYALGMLDIKGGFQNGTTFQSVNERNEKSLVLNAGSFVDQSNTYRLFKFFDFPQSNIDSKAMVYFGIEDRNNSGRFRFIANSSGSTNLFVFNRFQEELFKVYEDGNDNVQLYLPKENSRIVVGDNGSYLQNHKLVVRGSSMIEGNILTDSNIGIGTDSFTDNTDQYRLSVDGAVRAHRVKVYTSWADFVFEDGYQLPTLEEVEKHIKENGHLKDIPSAETVEENGIELGEMNKLLLQKIEELTLYVIQLSKEIDDIKNSKDE